MATVKLPFVTSAELPDRESDVEELTEAFVVARYSPRPVTSEEASLVKRSWMRVRGERLALLPPHIFE